MGAYDCDCIENLAYKDRKKRTTMQCRDCGFFAKTRDTEEYICAYSKERRAPNAVCNQDGKRKPLESNRINSKENNVKLKPCPYRVHGERVSSFTTSGEYYYNEIFMPCMRNECPCFHENEGDPYCDRNGTPMRMKKERTENV